MSRVVVIGAGAAGLCCAGRLAEAGQEVILLEASGRAGGRVQSDVVDGFILDHGFQVLLDAYPAAQDVLDYNALNLQPFGSGAIIYDGNHCRLLADPTRHPLHALSSIMHAAGSVGDKLRLFRLGRARSRETLDELFAHPDITTLEAWKAYGFSDRIIRQFLRPFYQGIFLENELITSRGMFEFTFSMFSRGRAVLPNEGMKAITEQLVRRIGAEHIRTRCRVEKADGKSVTLDTGESIRAAAVVRAHPPSLSDTDWNSVTCVYFRSPRPPYSGPWLALNGSGKGAVNQVAVPSNVAPGYAPPGQALISVSINGIPNQDDEPLYESVRNECRAWFRDQVDTWEPIAVYRIPYALPRQRVGNTPTDAPGVDDDGCITCGDHTAHASLQGAMASGHRAAKTVIEQISGVKA